MAGVLLRTYWSNDLHLSWNENHIFINRLQKKGYLLPLPLRKDPKELSQQIIRLCLWINFTKISNHDAEGYPWKVAIYTRVNSFLFGPELHH